MTYTFINVTGDNLKEIYSVKIGSTFYTEVGPYASTGDFAKSKSQTLDNFFTKIRSGDEISSLAILAPPIHRDGENAYFITNDQILTITGIDFFQITPIITGIIRNPERLNRTITILGEDLQGIEKIYFGPPELETFTEDFNFAPDGASVSDCLVVENAGSGFLSAVNFNNLTGTSNIPFYPYPRIDSLGTYTGVIGNNITILGKAFNHVTGVRFNEVLSENFTVNSNFSITAQIPSGKVQGRIHVSGYSGTYHTSSFDFEAIPLITGQYPLSGARGEPTRILGTGIIPEILFPEINEINEISNTGYYVQFRGLNATGLFYYDGNSSVTGLIPRSARRGLVNFIKPNSNFVPYYSNYFFIITGIQPIIESIDPYYVRNGFIIKGFEFDEINKVSLKHKDTNTIYDLISDARTGFSKSSELENEEGELPWLITVNGLKTGKFNIRNSSSYQQIPEGEYSVRFSDSDNMEYEYVSPTGDFYFVTNPEISGFSPQSGYFNSKINFFGTGLYSNCSLRFYTGNNIFRNLSNQGIQTFPDSKFKSGSFTLTRNNQSTYFPPDGLLKEYVTGYLAVWGGYNTTARGVNPGTGNATGIVPFTLLGPPYISGFDPKTARIGDTIKVSGYFKDIIDVSLIKPNSSTPHFTISNFNASDKNNGTFQITESVYRDSRGGGNILFNTLGGTVQSVDELIIKGFLPIASGFTPQPAYIGDTVTLTGANLEYVNFLQFSGTIDDTRDLSLSNTLSSDSFITGRPTGNQALISGSGHFLRFFSPSLVENNEFINLFTFDGEQVKSNTRFRNADDILFKISGYSGMIPVTGLAGDVFGISGSGFLNPTTFSLAFGVGEFGTDVFTASTDFVRVNDAFITGSIPKNINGTVFLSGKSGDSIQTAFVEPSLNLIPQISGVNKTVFIEDDVFVITGINNFYFSGNFFTGETLYRTGPQIKLAITGNRYGSSTGVVEYINYDISGFQYINGSLSLSGRLNSEFAGTGRLFLVDPNDSLSLGLPYNAVDINNINFINNPPEPGYYIYDSGNNFLSGYTKDYLSRNLSRSFNEKVTINEKQAILSGFYPPRGQLGSTLTLSGTSLRALTGIAIFSGSVISASSIPYDYECLYTYTLEDGVTFPYPLNYSKIKFDLPESFSESSGKLRLFSKNYATDSVEHFKFISAVAGGLSPTGGVGGDLISLIGDGFIGTEQVKFVNLDGEFATGVFSIVSDNLITVTVPNEGRLPAPQVASVFISQNIGDFFIGNFDVRQGSEKFYGNIQATGFISGTNFIGTGAGGRPTVNGSGVLLVGEATAGGGSGTIIITGGLDTTSASEILTGNGTQSLFSLRTGIFSGIKGSTIELRSSAVIVSIDGLIQDPVRHYSIIDPLGGSNFSGLQFVIAPVTGADIEVRRFGDTVVFDGGGNNNLAIIYALVLG